MHIDTRNVELRNPKNAVFSDCAPRLYGAGMAAVPLGQKDPLVKGYRKWTRRPGRLTFDKWCSKFPEANVGYVPGLTGKHGIVVIDDDGGARRRIIELFGETPGIVQASRANHYLYRAPEGIDLQYVNLKKLGVNADFKIGNSIVVGPGSVHETGHVYRWQDCDERIIADLPELDLRRLRDLIRSKETPTGTQAELKAKAGFRDGSRKLALNDHLAAHASWADNFDEVLDAATSWNDEHLAKYGIDKLDEGEVMQVAARVWQDLEAGKLERWHGRAATVRSNLNEMTKLAATGKHGTAAFMLLMKLRGEHGARGGRNETFALNQIAMAKAQTIPHWTRYDYEKARDILLEAGKLEKVADFKMTKHGRQGAQYRLT